MSRYGSLLKSLVGLRQHCLVNITAWYILLHSNQSWNRTLGVNLKLNPKGQGPKGGNFVPLCTLILLGVKLPHLAWKTIYMRVFSGVNCQTHLRRLRRDCLQAMLSDMATVSLSISFFYNHCQRYALLEYHSIFINLLQSFQMQNRWFRDFSLPSIKFPLGTFTPRN